MKFNYNIFAATVIILSTSTDASSSTNKQQLRGGQNQQHRRASIVAGETFPTGCETTYKGDNYGDCACGNNERCEVETCYENNKPVEDSYCICDPGYVEDCRGDCVDEDEVYWEYQEITDPLHPCNQITGSMNGLFGNIMITDVIDCSPQCTYIGPTVGVGETCEGNYECSTGKCRTNPDNTNEKHCVYNNIKCNFQNVDYDTYFKATSSAVKIERSSQSDTYFYLIPEDNGYLPTSTSEFTGKFYFKSIHGDYLNANYNKNKLNLMDDDSKQLFSIKKYCASNCYNGICGNCIPYSGIYIQTESNRKVIKGKSSSKEGESVKLGETTEIDEASRRWEMNCQFN